jgi:hypothetical protein
VSAGLLAQVELEEPALERPLGILHLRDRALGPIAEQFIQLLQADAEFQTPPIQAPITGLRETSSRVV